MDKNTLFIEETTPDKSYVVVWKGKDGNVNDFGVALEMLLSYPSPNRLELWSKGHAEGPKGFAPMAYREAGQTKGRISNTLKMLMTSH